MPTLRTALPAVLAAALAAPALGTQGPAAPDTTISAEERREVIEGVLARLDSAYVFPETAAAMARAVREREARGEYASLGRARAFADSLTSHLRQVSGDKHLGVYYSARPIDSARPDEAPTAEMRERMKAQLRAINFGFERVERLEGNVGYLELRGFAPADAEGAEEVVAAAMSFLARTDALIVDLRRNGGGDPAMVRLVTSYLFGPEPVHLNSLYWRPDDRTEEFWTLREVKGERFGPERPVWVLTSGRTFSGAEEFAYNLQTRRRATIVGETTGGGAHPGGMQRVTAHFGVWVPSGRAINPITKTNWEGTGVVPDVKVKADDALHAAHVAALEDLVRRSPYGPEHKAAVERVLREKKAAQ